MEFDPVKLTIEIDWVEMKKAYCWRRQAIALYAHELTHLFEWVFIFRFNCQKWNNNPDPEKRAEFIQDIMLNLLKVDLN